MSDTASTFCVCGKRNYENRGAALAERAKLRGNGKRWQRRGEQSARDIEPYWCPRGGLWHLGHQIGMVRKWKRGRRRA